MALLSLQNIDLAFGGPKLLDQVTLNAEKGERICVLGRNGEGRSTLLRVIAGQETPDQGTMSRKNGLRVSYLPQEVPGDMSGTVEELVAGELDLHDQNAHLQVQQVISHLELDAMSQVQDLSGGQKRRALLGRALADDPDVLLLDEPTNHLDIESIRWMETLLIRFSGAVVFVSHDRAFLRQVATRIVELDRGQLQSWDCDYERYLVRREQALAAEEKQNAQFDKKLAQEERWIRQGIKARRTRNEGRVRSLKKMREERRARRERSGAATISLQEGGTSGRKVLAVKHLSYAWTETEPLVKELDFTLMRGDKVGLLGPNGCGKSTLLKLMLGQIEPQAGSIEHGTELEITYFDQHRMKLEDEASLADNIGNGSEFVLVNGKRRHVLSYLEDFLFSPARSRTPVKALSGGERNRLLLAKMFLQPSNLLIMDEPTNDLDVETLELLESLLVEYAGTLLLVSHDRAFINNVVTSTLAFEGDGLIREYPGGYDDWVKQRKAFEPEPVTATVPKSKTAPRKKTNPLKNKEREELAKLPGQIEELDAELQDLLEQMALPEFYQNDPADIARVTARTEEIPEELEQAYARWEELEARQ